MKKIFTFLFLLNFLVIAETYKDIGPFQTLADIKNKFPNANFQILKPAWAQENDVLYSVTGVGLSGTIILKFSDTKSYYCKMLETISVNDTDQYNFFKSMCNKNDGENLQIEWVRWLPDEAIPKARVFSKYGKADTLLYTDDSFKPYYEWYKKGVSAVLDDEQKNIIIFDFSFTTKDSCYCHKLKYGTFPKNINCKKYFQ